MIGALTGAGLAEALAGISSAFAGQTLSDTYDDVITDMIDVDGDVQIGYTVWTTDLPSISGDTQDSISPGTGATPVDAWNDYVENEPFVTVSPITGGASSGSTVHTFLYSIMEENPGTAQAVVRAVAPVAIPIAAAVTAIAQAAGISVDYNNLDATVRENLTNALTAVGTVYENARDKLIAWKDALGNILFPKKAFDAIYDSLQEQGIGGTGGYQLIPDPDSGIDSCTFDGLAAVNTGSAGGYSYELQITATASVFGCINQYNEGSNAKGTICSSQPVSARMLRNGRQVMSRNGSAYTKDGQTVYWVNLNEQYGPGWQSVIPGTSYSPENYSIKDLAWYIVYGEHREIGEFPEGTSESDATSYTPSTIPVAGNLATSYDPDTGILGTEPLVPVHITDNPEDSTGDTTDPASPTDEDNPGVLSPPLPLPIPDTSPSNPEVPLVNPSIVDSTLIDELIEELANTLDPQPPQSSGVIPVPPLPGIYDPDTGQTTFPSIIPQSGPGFIHVYNPTPAEFVAFGTWLWVTYADATIDKILNNPFDGVIGAHELYATPNRDGSDNIRSAFLTCPTTAALVTNRYSEIDCGTVIVPEFYGNYLDYSPYSQAYIYLPFIGINEVSIDDIVGHAINIRYRVDSYSGSCIAMIFVAKDGYQNLCYQFAGSCSVEVPMAGGSQAAIKAGMMQAEAYARAAMIQAGANAVGGIGSALLGNLGGVLSSLSGIASNYAQAQAGVEAAKVANKSSVQHSGQFGASHGAMGEKIPFFIIRNPIQVKVVNYNEDYGLPAHKRVIVGGCRGYLRVREVNVISAHATDEEKMAIEMALKGGVYVS